MFAARQAMEFSLIENVQRQDLSPIEEAEGYRRLLEEFNHKHDALAKIVGKSRSHITNMLRLLTLPEPVKEMMGSGAISMGHARAIITAKDPLALAKEIVKHGLSSRQAEALADVAATGAREKKHRAAQPVDLDLTMIEKDVEKYLGMKAKIHTKGKRGTITVYYNDLDQLDGVIKRLTYNPNVRITRL